jgi:hypothetical protein
METSTPYCPQDRRMQDRIIVYQTYFISVGRQYQLGKVVCSDADKIRLLEITPPPSTWEIKYGPVLSGKIPGWLQSVS